jgi:hypothetical protein
LYDSARPQSALANGQILGASIFVNSPFN